MQGKGKEKGGEGKEVRGRKGKGRGRHSAFAPPGKIS